jgi:uncharacterized protein (DUF1330 family)
VRSSNREVKLGIGVSAIHTPNQKGENSNMSAYVVVEIEINDSSVYEEYKKAAPSSIAAYGGKYLARGGACEILEGNWLPKRLVILQFDTMTRAKQWLESQEYSEARKLRHKSANTKMILVEGIS